MSVIWNMYAKPITFENCVTIVILCLLFGLISPAPIIVKYHRMSVKDIKGGTYSPLSILRSFGLVPGAVTALYDFAKVEVAMSLAFVVFRWNPTAAVLAGCATVCGHLLPWYFGRRGDRGWCPYLGLSLLMLQFPGVWLLIAAAFLAGSVNCMVLFIATFTLATPIFAAFYGLDVVCVSAVAFTSLAVLITHIPVIKRLANKTEPTIVDVLKQLYEVVVVTRRTEI